MSDEDRMDALLRQLAAEEYNRPPEIVPREQMWEAIRQGSGKREAGSGETAGTGNGEHGTVLPFHRRVPRWVYYAVAAALLLALGIQLGRLLGPSPTQQLAPRTTQPDSLGPTRVSPESSLLTTTSGCRSCLFCATLSEITSPRITVCAMSGH